MKRLTMLLICAAVLASGCSGAVKKNIYVLAYPPDAVIKVVSGDELREKKYTSPARISIEMPTDPAMIGKARLEVRKNEYLTKTIPLRDLVDGQTLNIKLEKERRDTTRYKLTYRMISPALSQDLQFRDKIISLSLGIADQWFQLSLENVSPHEMKILWDRAEYSDANERVHRLMHSGIRYQDRNNPIPTQVIPSRGSIQQAVIPIEKVTYSQQKKTYEVLPLFDLDSDAAAGLKGRSINLFIAVEIDRQIIPYNLRIEITNAIKETGEN